MAIDTYTSLASHLENLSSSSSLEVLRVDDDARTRLLEAMRRLVPELETPQEMAQRLFYGPCEITGAKVGIDLGIFKLLSESPQPLQTDQIASTTGADPAILRRLLKYMASLSQIREVDVDAWAASHMTRALALRGIEAGVNHNIENVNPAWAALPGWLRDKKYQATPSKQDTPFSAAHGEPFFPWLQKHPFNAKEFNIFMTSHRTGHRSWLDSFDVKRELGASITHGVASSPPDAAAAAAAAAVTLVDVGGGIGHVCADFKERYPDLFGRVILQDLPSVIAQALPTPGVENMAIDFFEGQPIDGAAAYFLRSIIRDWPDDSSRVILKHIVQAMADHSVVLIDEIIVPDRAAHKVQMSLDMTMMAMLNAQARTESAWTALLESVGLAIDKIVYYEHGDREGVIVARKKGTARPASTVASTETDMTNGAESLPETVSRETPADSTTTRSATPPSFAPSPPLAPLSSEDLNQLQRCVFDWCDSYDQKDWSRLASNVAPALRIDYRDLGLGFWPEMPAADYVAMCSAADFIGDPLVMCQHMVGASYFVRTGPDTAEGRHQIRAAHQRYKDAGLKEVTVKGHAHASNVHWYRRVDGVWRLAGLKPKVLWAEYDFERIWEAAGKRMAEEAKEVEAEAEGKKTAV